jgi:hypothetical protein
VAQDLASDKIVGWFQGRFEIGPRALGNRSILASPLNKDVKEMMNARIKFREPFRPFAPAVLAEHAAEYFEIREGDPYMTVAVGFGQKGVMIPAAVHVDGTARVQTVDRIVNPRYYAVIEAFMKLTGVPVILNTSFNKQEPIVVARKRLSHASSGPRWMSWWLATSTVWIATLAVRRAADAFQVLEANRWVESRVVACSSPVPPAITHQPMPSQDPELLEECRDGARRTRSILRSAPPKTAG